MVPPARQSTMTMAQRNRNLAYLANRQRWRSGTSRASCLTPSGHSIGSRSTMASPPGCNAPDARAAIGASVLRSSLAGPLLFEITISICPSRSKPAEAAGLYCRNGRGESEMDSRCQEHEIVNQNSLTRNPAFLHCESQRAPRSAPAHSGGFGRSRNHR